MDTAGIRHTQAVVVLLLVVGAHSWNNLVRPLHLLFAAPCQPLLVSSSWTAGTLSDSPVVSPLHLGLAEL